MDVKPRPTILRSAVGVDLSYSSKRRADSAAAVVGHLLSDHRIAVSEIHRWKGPFEETVIGLRALQTRLAGYPFASYVSGPEVGVLTTLSLLDPPITIAAMPARFSKFVRSMKTAAMWNRGHIIVNKYDPNLSEFVRIVCAFDGSEDGIDDEVDALVSLHDRLMLGALSSAKKGQYTHGRRCM